MGVEWGYFNKFEDVNDQYLPDRGEGDTVATQIVTAVNKLIYKWYNDGDVFDNTHGMQGWANDLSSYANWLYANVPESEEALDRIWSCRTDDAYEKLLRKLADTLLDADLLEVYDESPRKGSVYDCDGPFEFEWHNEDEEEEYQDDEDDESYYGHY